MGWCDEFEKEFVNLKALGVDNLDFSGKKDCLAATFYQNGNSSNLTFFTDECKVKKRAICEDVYELPTIFKFNPHMQFPMLTER
jgi:hypothetical protein